MTKVPSLNYEVLYTDASSRSIATAMLLPGAMRLNPPMKPTGFAGGLSATGWLQGSRSQAGGDHA